MASMRLAEADQNRDGQGEPNRRAMKAIVDSGVVPGLLGYLGGRPIAWCSIGPRSDLPGLGERPELAPIDDRPVWSVVCFFVKRQFRNRGFTAKLIDTAVEYAKQNGAACLEAYPVDPDSPSYKYMGLRPAFEKKGFDYVGRTGTRRHVMRRIL